MEISGLASSVGTASAPSVAKSTFGHWKCGPHRAKFIAETVMGLKQSYESLGSGLHILAGSFEHAIQNLLEGLRDAKFNVGALWMTTEHSLEEKKLQEAVATLCTK